MGKGLLVFLLLLFHVVFQLVTVHSISRGVSRVSYDRTELDVGKENADTDTSSRGPIIIFLDGKKKKMDGSIGSQSPPALLIVLIGLGPVCGLGSCRCVFEV